MPRARWVVLAIAMGLVLLLVVLRPWTCFRAVPPEVLELATPDTVPDKVLVKHRPGTARGIGRRITTTRVAPALTVSEGAPDTGAAHHYADAVHEADSLRQLADSLRRRVAAGDRTINLNTLPQPRRLLPPMQGQVTRGDVTLWSTRSDGSIARARAKLGAFHPTLAFVTGFDKGSDTVPLITRDRIWLALAKQGWHCLRPSVAMGGVGALLGNAKDRLGSAALTGGLTLLGCLAG